LFRNANLDVYLAYSKVAVEILEARQPIAVQPYHLDVREAAKMLRDGGSALICEIDFFALGSIFLVLLGDAPVWVQCENCGAARHRHMRQNIALSDRRLVQTDGGDLAGCAAQHAQ